MWLILVNYLIWEGNFKYTGLLGGYGICIKPSNFLPLTQFLNRRHDIVHILILQPRAHGQADDVLHHIFGVGNLTYMVTAQ